MKNQKMYEADDKMISIIRDNYNILQSLGSFGINLGFGDKTVKEVCEEQEVDTYTFLAVVNFTINGYKEYDNADRLSLPTLLHYLKASHAYYIDFQLPFIRKELVEALDEKDNLARLILKLYDDYAHSITYDIYNNEEWLAHHSEVEEEIFIPAVRNEERKLKQNDVSVKITNMINSAPQSDEQLSDREKDVIVALVQGMTNKEIADHLFISINTVITHRRNIARKLQIHSPAGLTIYAIVNNLVDITSVKL